ncbi:HAD superfamily hydrolase (TIGR01509 family) [Rhodopseudomonas rhenobacensis]|uniref:HAD superfamily hydrolase (TIGR01509 family) n=1 Tax=Rhodopseudomonas rhenobacensis TaxID=87461 RepID=A0A7W7Z498_9BRAD|nr:HAD superfamily hydrolase (TIGR01509 family) [Rhodopseudomonas rhenobacensis]
MSVDLVIFDCDGVLVDSEIISCRVYAQALSRYGYPITADQVHDRFLGRSSRETRLEVERELGRMLPDDFQAQLNAELFGELETSLEPMPHIDEALDAILQPVCVASSGPLQKISVSLNRVGLTQRFAPHIFSATQVNRGKPAPDLFLYAAMQMGAEPSRCLVVEDSVAGVTAARAAGMVALGFAGGSHCRPGHGESLRHAGAQASFVDMRQLYDIISQF